MILGSLSFYNWYMILNLLLTAVVSAKHHHGNPTNEIVNIINENRTIQKLPKLNDNPGLGCIALQYIKECKGNCTNNNTVNCKHTEDDFTEVFAPNCGVELPTFGTISGRIVGCQSTYLEPSVAFSNILVNDWNSLSILKGKNHSEVGVGLIKNHHGPYFWCVLFSTDKINSTFVLEDGGKGIKQKTGCYSGTNVECSEGKRNKLFFLNLMTMILVVFYLLH